METLFRRLHTELIDDGESVTVKLAVVLTSWAAMKDADVSTADNLRSVVIVISEDVAVRQRQLSAAALLLIQ